MRRGCNDPRCNKSTQLNLELSQMPFNTEWALARLIFAQTDIRIISVDSAVICSSSLANLMAACIVSLDCNVLRCHRSAALSRKISLKLPALSTSLSSSFFSSKPTNDKSLEPKVFSPDQKTRTVKNHSHQLHMDNPSSYRAC